MKCKCLNRAWSFFLCASFLLSCSVDNKDSISFIIDTKESGLANTYGLSVQIGVMEGPEYFASSIIDEDGNAVFSVDLNNFIDKTIWVCIPSVVKYFHILTHDEVADALLVLPDKDKGSTLLTGTGAHKAGGKFYQNDWIVAYYMGINKDGNSDTPIYWASGNLIATKINDENDGDTKVAFHIATWDETKDEAVEGVFLGMDRRLQSNVSDSYKALPVGTQWDLYGFGDATGKILYEDSKLEEYIVITNQLKDGEILYDTNKSKNCDIANVQLGGSWRTPSGGNNEYNEFAAFADDGFPDLIPNASEWIENGIKLGYKYGYVVEINNKVITTNILYFPAAGYRHAGNFAAGRGMSGWYWSSTADPTCTPPYVPNGVYEGEVTEYTTAFNLGFLPGNNNWYPHPRTSVQAIRPVTE